MMMEDDEVVAILMATEEDVITRSSFNIVSLNLAVEKGGIKKIVLANGDNSLLLPLQAKLQDIDSQGTLVKVRRPSDYNPSLAAALGPSRPNPNLNLAAVGLTPGSAGGLEGPDRIFVGGLPYYFTEAQV